MGPPLHFIPKREPLPPPSPWPFLAWSVICAMLGALTCLLVLGSLGVCR